MNIYLIIQDENKEYDTFDSAVVIARHEDEARHMHPRTGKRMTKKDWVRGYSDWCSAPDKVKVLFLGCSTWGVKAGVICASFNAG